MSLVLFSTGLFSAAPLIIADRQNLWFSLAGLAFASLATAPLSLILLVVVPLGSGPVGSVHPGWIIAALGLGVGIHGLGGIAFRQANLDSRDLAVNSLYFLGPVLSIVWLSIAGISLRRPGLLWIGAALVFSANGLIAASLD